VSGSDTFDPDTAGSYTVEYIHTTSTGLVKKVTRVFNVDYYEVLTFTAEERGNSVLSITGNGTTSVTLEKASGTVYWGVGAYVSTGFEPPFTIEYDLNNPPNGDCQMVSLNNEIVTTETYVYQSLDYAPHPLTLTTWNVVHNGSTGVGTNVGGSYGSSQTWSSADKKYQVYDGDVIKHYSGNNLMYTSPTGLGNITRYIGYRKNRFWWHG
jgi:hypothetical protein